MIFSMSNIPALEGDLPRAVEADLARCAATDRGEGTIPGERGGGSIGEARVGQSVLQQQQPVRARRRQMRAGWHTHTALANTDTPASQGVRAQGEHTAPPLAVRRKGLA